MKKVTFLSLLAFTQLLMAQNLIVNGDFNSDIVGWSSGSINLVNTWIADDGAEGSGAGCLEVDRGLITSNASFRVFSEWMPVREYFVYEINATFKVPTGSAIPRAFLTVDWFDEFGHMIGSSDSSQASSEFGVPLDLWLDIGGFVDAPEQATSAQLNLFFQGGTAGDTDPSFGRWDDVLVRADTLFIDGFE